MAEYIPAPAFDQGLIARINRAPVLPHRVVISRRVMYRADEWVEHPDQPGTYQIVQLAAPMYEFRFSDENVAFEFKMRFG